MYQYHELLIDILEYGELDRPDRTGTGTQSTFGAHIEVPLYEGFPLVTTKSISFDSVASELLWFLEGSTDERRLAELRYGLPREELIAKKTIWTDNANSQGLGLGLENTPTVKELGPVYGAQWRTWPKYKDQFNRVQPIDQIANLVKSLKEDPFSRRHIVSAWNVAELDEMALPPCHLLSQFYVTGDLELCCIVTQRSADVFLGVPYNIASYALLVHMLAHVTGLGIGTLRINFGDAHIYNNHVDQVQEQLSREPKSLPKLTLNRQVSSIFDFKLSDFELSGYDPYPPLKGKMAV
jgi:thymidylate synthase